MYKIPLVLCALTLLCISCKKKETVTPKIPPQPDVIYPDYARLKPGNYWIYQVFEVDTFGNATPTGVFDSVYAGPEKEFNGKMFQLRMAPETAGSKDYTGAYMRDSLYYIVAPNGKIRFSSTDFEKTFSSWYFDWSGSTDTAAFIHTFMTDKDKKTIVPAGTFQTAAFDEQWNMYPGYRNGGIIIEQKIKYNIDIGIVSEALPFYVYTAHLRKERRLVRYSVKK
ncbi:MAG: hypothetical protein WC716_10585 [Chitinophagaceae bacterium]|jgi:hypothetical protein